MRTRNILSGVVLAVSTALFSACSDPIAAPAETQVAAFARNPTGSPDGNKSCLQDGGTRASKNAKNQCEGGGGGGGGGGIPTAFSGFVYFFQNTVISIECSQYGVLCENAKTAAGGDGNIRMVNIDIHGNSGGLGAPVIPNLQAGFNSALLTKVAFHSFADGSESLVVAPGAGFYYTSIYWWSAFIAKPGFAPTSYFDPNFAVSDPAGPKGSHYVSVTYNGTVYNYLILSQN